MTDDESVCGGLMEAPNPQWLEEELARGVSEKWCMRRGCTTCGSFQMVELLTETPVSGRASLRNALDGMKWSRAEEVVEGLRNCGRDTNTEAIIWLLYMIWQRWGDRTHQELFPALDGTFAGKVLSNMKAHYAHTLERQRLHYLRLGVKKKDWTE